MIIDCGTCVARHTTACEDCIVSLLCDDGVLELDRSERTAIEAMGEAGLIAPIRLVSREPDRRARGSG